MFNQSTECFMEFFRKSQFEVQGEGLLVPQGCLEAQRWRLYQTWSMTFGVSKHGEWLRQALGSLGWSMEEDALEEADVNQLVIFHIFKKNNNFTNDFEHGGKRLQLLLW